MTGNDKATAMTVGEALTGRRSTRDFTDRPVPVETIRAIMDEARWTPSWADSQPWKVYVATGATAQAIKDGFANKEALGLRSGSEVPAAPGAQWGAQAERNMDGWSRSLVAAVGQEGRGRFTAAQRTLFAAPTFAIITVHRNANPYELFDAGALEQSILLSAHAHGVDTVPAVAFVHYPTLIHDKLGIPGDEAIVVGIGMGYRSDDPMNDFRSPRMELDDILTIRD